MVRLSAKGKVKGEYRGVRMRNWGSWVCEIRISNSKKQDEEQSERIWLGSFDSSMKAAIAYDFAAFYLRGSKAKLNFPQTPPPPSHSHHYPTKWKIKEAASRYANHMIATTMREEHNRKASQANRANSTWSRRKNVEVPDSCSSSTSTSSNITKEEGTANQLNMDTDLTHHSDPLHQQHFDLALLDDKAIEELCGFLRSHSNSKWWVL